MSAARRGGAEQVRANEALSDGLSPLDEERAESMASEGGRSAQAVAGAPLPVVEPSLLPRPRWPWWVALSLGAVLGYFGYLGLRRAG